MIGFMAIRAQGFDAAGQESGAPPVARTGALIRREGERVQRRVAELVRNEGFFANAARQLKYAVRGRMDARADENGRRTDGARVATNGFAEWARDCGYRFQRGTLDQLFARAVSALLDTGEAYLQRVIDRAAAEDVADGHRNGLFVQVWSARDVFRGIGRDGHEFNERGRYLGTWFRGETPDDYERTYTPTFVRAADLVEMRLAEDSSATQGISWGTAAVRPAREVQLADEARLASERVNSCLSAIAIAEPTSPPLAGQLISAGTVAIEDPDGYQVQDLVPGSVSIARGVKDIVVTRPSGQGQTPATRVARVAAGMGMAVQAITGNLAETNFSAARYGDIMTERTATDLRERGGVRAAKDGLLRWFVARERELGRDFGRYRWTWLRRPRRAIDPETEAKAQAVRLDIGVTSRREEIEADGRDPDEVIGQIQEEQRAIGDTDDARRSLRLVC